MLDIETYRAHEKLARQAISSWRLGLINSPHVFAACGFPVRIDAVQDLTQILDTMQEARFDYYMAEIGGVSDDEAGFLTRVVVDFVDFYQKHFFRDRTIVPLSTLMAHYVIYRKLLGYDPGFKRVLEIGPGCGYLSFFLRHHAGLEEYAQIETTESFYILQSLINSHCFGSGFQEHAIHEVPDELHNFYKPKAKWYYEWHYEEQKLIDHRRPVVCRHFPWWRIGDAAERKYDIVTSNANLNEFSESALIQYLSLIRDVLEPGGALVSQCLGGGPMGYDKLLDIVHSLGFATAAAVAVDQLPGKLFCVSNAVFVKEGHPVHSRFKEKPTQWPRIDRDVDFVERIYYQENRGGPARRKLSTDDMLSLTRDALARRGDSGRPAAPQIAVRPRPAQSAPTVPTPVLAQAVSVLEESARHARALDAGGLRARIAELEGDVAKIRASTSWRATAPLRFVSRLVWWLKNDPRALVAHAYRRLLAAGK